jgi:hypothetical protein
LLMIIARPLPSACPRCGVWGKFGIMRIANNKVHRGCNSCGAVDDIHLPALRKKVLYLDQNFLSHAFRKKNIVFVEAAKRIASLAARQLLVCPWSPLHETETRQWRSDEQQNLLAFIKETARGHRFRTPHGVQWSQVARAFLDFEATRASRPIEPDDAFEGDVHQWDDYFWIDVTGFAFDDPERVRAGKEGVASGLVAAFSLWRRQVDTTFENHIALETKEYASALLKAFVTLLEARMRGDVDGVLNAPIDSEIVDRLLREFDSSVPTEERMKAIRRFLGSSRFADIPYVWMSCRLFAMLREDVLRGRFNDEAKARRKLRGISFDVDAVSVYAPYCDAHFVDREMRRWIVGEPGKVIDRFGLCLLLSRYLGCLPPVPRRNRSSGNASTCPLARDGLSAAGIGEFGE